MMHRNIIINIWIIENFLINFCERRLKAIDCDLSCKSCAQNVISLHFHSDENSF